MYHVMWPTVNNYHCNMSHVQLICQRYTMTDDTTDRIFFAGKIQTIADRQLDYRRTACMAYQN